MHSSFQKNKFHDHTIRILENRRVGTGGGKHRVSPPPGPLQRSWTRKGMEAKNQGATFGESRNGFLWSEIAALST